jgi:hypothetical protein
MAGSCEHSHEPWIPYKVDHFLTSWVTTSFSRRPIHIKTKKTILFLTPLPLSATAKEYLRIYPYEFKTLKMSIF